VLPGPGQVTCSPAVTIRKGSGLEVDERMDLNRGANDDVIVTDVRRRGQKMKRIFNVYDQRDTQSAERQAQQVNWQRVNRQGGTVLV